MKLEKREITLNERDSLKDVYYLEERLALAYKEGVKGSFRKEVVGELAALQTQADGEVKRLLDLLDKSRRDEF